MLHSPSQEVLASIFLQLRLSERSGRGVPKIVGVYGRDSIKIQKNFIVVTIPFNRINVTPFELKTEADAKPKESTGGQKSGQKIMALILQNPNITTTEMAGQLGMARSGVAKQIASLQKKNLIRRVGPDKGGHWEIVE